MTDGNHSPGHAEGDQGDSDDHASWRRLLVAGILLVVPVGVVVALFVTRTQQKREATVPPTDSGQSVAEQVIMQPQYAAASKPHREPPKALVELLPRPDADSAYQVVTPAKQWPADRMYEKINGEDFIYLQAGCRALAAMTLGQAGGDEMLELFLFEMNDPAAAAEVFEKQKPPSDAARSPESLELGDEGYTHYGSCYVRCGRYYLKIIVAGQSQAADLALELTRRFVSSVPAGLAESR